MRKLRGPGRELNIALAIHNEKGRPRGTLKTAPRIGSASRGRCSGQSALFRSATCGGCEGRIQPCHLGREGRDRGRRRHFSGDQGGQRHGAQNGTRKGCVGENRGGCGRRSRARPRRLGEKPCRGRRSRRRCRPCGGASDRRRRARRHHEPAIVAVEKYHVPQCSHQDEDQ